MSQLRFCMVTTFYPPYHFGGDAMYVYRLTEALAERGHEVDVVHSVDAYRLQHPAEPELTFAHHPGVTRYPLESKRPGLAAFAAHQLGRPALYAKRLRQLLEQRSHDVIHYHNTSLVGGPGVLALGAAVKLLTANEYWLICPTHVLFYFNREACTRRRCLACTLHYRRPPQLWRYTGALRRALRHVDCLLMPSRFALDQHGAQGLQRPMVHLPYLIPTPPPITACSSTGDARRPYFLYVGRLEKLKGVQDLLTVFRGYREAELWIAGSGSYRPALEDQARGLPHVRFLGQVDLSSLASLYREAVALLVPSLCYETFGITVGEAFSFGTPAIVRRIGALRENLEQSGGGYAYDTPEECRSAMERLRTDAELRASLGRRGHLTWRQHWSPEAHLERYLGILGPLLEARRAGRGHGRAHAGALTSGRA